MDLERRGPVLHSGKGQKFAPGMDGETGRGVALPSEACQRPALHRISGRNVEAGAEVDRAGTGTQVEMTGRRHLEDVRVGVRFR